MKNEKISLCVITGNCEEIISRFLSSFRGIADEICVVRAIGSSAPDKTLEIAESMGCRVGEYLNAQCWPHVDNFAAARNHAFAMASHEWVMWADIDDTISPESIAELRKMVELANEGVDMIRCAYNVPDQFVKIVRERLMRRGKFTWHNPVHECVTPVNKKEFSFQTAPTAEILHAPKVAREKSNERNLRILAAVPESERGAGHYFYLFSENMGLRNYEAASEAAIAFLKRPDGSAPERYEAWIGLSGMPGIPPEQVATFLHSAYREDPRRAEALYELANLEMTCGTAEHALAYAHAMRSLPRPPDAPWNTRDRFYGWAGEQIETQALRVSGFGAKADAIEFNRWRAAGGKISLLHATLGRVAQATKARRDWLERAKNPAAIEHIFAIDDTDELSRQYLTRFRHVITPGGFGCVGAWNEAARVASGEILVQVSDDFLPPWGWDEQIISRIGDLSKPAVLAVSDGNRSDRLLCMAIATRARVNQQGGFLFHPSFLSMYSDNHFTESAYRDGVVIDARDLVFHHAHPAFGSAEMDITYAQSNSKARYSQGEGVLNRLRDGVATWRDVPGWCDFHDLYEDFANRLQPGETFVEVGSWMGQSIIYLAQRIQDLGKTGIKLICVDTFRGGDSEGGDSAVVAQNGGSVLDAFMRNIQAAGVADMVTVIQDESVSAASRFADGSLAGIFIDAAHEYEPVKSDILAWAPKVRLDGFLAGHDYLHEPVRKAVGEIIEATPASRRCWVRK